MAHGSLEITDPVWKGYADFMGLTAEHVALVHELWDAFDHHAAVDRFHDKVVAQPELDAIVRAYSTSGRLKAAWTAHWEAFTGGRVDDAYIESRLRMGETHVRVSLGQAWYLAAYTWMFDMLVAAAIEKHRDNPERLGRAIDALFRLVSLDMQAGVQAYIDETLRLRDEREEELSRLQREAERREAEAVMLGRQMKQAAENLAAAAQELAAQVQQMNGQAQQMSDAADQIQRSAIEAGQRVDEGQSRAHDAVRYVTETADIVSKFAEAMEVVHERVRKIEDVTQLVDGLASQTNLLSLNAAIEAARAGEHGRGFAVVADEVRRLADHTQAALAEIANLAEEIRSAVDSVSRGVGEAVASSNESKLAVDTVLEKLRLLTANANATLAGFADVSEGLRNFSVVAREIRHVTESVAAQAARLAGPVS